MCVSGFLQGDLVDFGVLEVFCCVFGGLLWFFFFLFAGVLFLFLSNKEMLKIYLDRERKMLITSTLALKRKVATAKQNYFLNTIFPLHLFISRCINGALGTERGISKLFSSLLYHIL